MFSFLKDKLVWLLTATGFIAVAFASQPVDVDLPEVAIKEQQDKHFLKYGEYKQVLSTRRLPEQAKRGFLEAGFDESVVPDGYAIDVWDGPKGKGYTIITPISVTQPPATSTATST